MKLNLIHASIIVIYPKQPFIDWVNDQLKRDSLPILTIENYHDESGAFTYLIPDFEDLSKAKRWVKKHYLILLEEALLEWSLDEEDWPEDLSYKLFSQWFDLEFNLSVFDLRALY